MESPKLSNKIKPENSEIFNNKSMKKTQLNPANQEPEG
jgi:hypothetical protein